MPSFPTSWLLNLLLQAHQQAPNRSSSIVDQSEGWPWEVHLLTIPLVFFFGLAVGWILRERKLANDEARERLQTESKGVGNQ